MTALPAQFVLLPAPGCPLGWATCGHAAVTPAPAGI